MGYNVAVDVGGTFTDVLVFNEETGVLTMEKVLSTGSNQSQGVIDGVVGACRKVGIPLSFLNLFFHGSTVVTNLILESAGARVGLMTNRGHEHMLHLARSWTPGPLYGWIGLQKPEPIADLTDTRGISARLAADGSEVRPLNVDETRRTIQELLDRGVESIAVALLNAYVNPTHERLVRELIREMAPNVPVSISSDMAQEYGEYERTLTTVLNTYARPRVMRYLSSLDNALEQQGFSGTMNIVRSDGGAMSSSAAAEHPVHIALSGPSGGVVGAAYLARTIGIPNVLALDMGGTSTDVSLCLDGVPSVRREVQLGYYRFKSPTVDVHSVGAGGGSIAHVALTGALLVGPQSAGADPGPACYGRGGTEPTVTDANVVLHRLPPSVKLGGSLAIDEEAARRAVKKVADKIGLSVVEAAQGIIDIVNENMYAALRVVSVERGYDPRRFGLVAFGGAGPMHANALGQLIHANLVIIPLTPGVMSAFGFLSSNIQNEFSETYLKLAAETPAKDLRERLANLIQEAKKWLESEGVSEAQQAFDCYVDCRYYLQGIQISCSVSLDELQGGDCGVVRRIFEDEHRRRYNFDLDLPMEMAGIRVVGHGTVRGVSLMPSDMDDSDPSSALAQYEDVYFHGEWMRSPIYLRHQLKPGNIVKGPAVVQQDDSTVVIEPQYQGTVDRFGNILIETEGLH
jgi:N-methylhydantoinase A